MGNKKRILGFTLTELLIVIFVIAVTSGLAVPPFMRTIEESRSNEANGNLRTICAAEKLYKIDRGSFWPAGGQSRNTSQHLAEINQRLNVDLSVDHYRITITSGSGAATYTAVADRTKAGSTKKFTITNANCTPVASGSY